ncbi:hypothetical protein RchiOBHm_Chr2g0108941 [Rosa chinensis]|uniref:Uncharacterized protein n=1 Tax=Rosa chinensis TaxID=74649 RepID=A0A2P6RPD9_ROSCH|nr:hypothetical protein RchiOBHm_Chr2g0108941 [Rosa chinensis]
MQYIYFLSLITVTTTEIETDDRQKLSSDMEADRRILRCHLMKVDCREPSYEGIGSIPATCRQH